MTAWVCTWEGCDQPAAARVGVPLLPYPAGRGLGYVVIHPPDAATATGFPMCLDHVHLQVDVVLMKAKPEAAA